MQPGYLPWLGFFELIENCDQFVILDDVQYTKRDWRSRNRIRTKAGCIWLTVPILSKGKEAQLIKDVEINNDISWCKDHFNSIKINYSKAPFFKTYIDYFAELYTKNWENLIDLDMDIICYLSKALNITKPIIRSSTLSISILPKNQRIIEICKKLNADELYDSKAAESFIDLELFKKEGIKIEFQDYKHPVYKQLYEPFIEYMSVIDLLFNEGPSSKTILLGNYK